MQVDATGWPSEPQVERKSKTCINLRVRLARALGRESVHIIIISGMSGLEPRSVVCHFIVYFIPLISFTVRDESVINT